MPSSLPPPSSDSPGPQRESQPQANVPVIPSGDLLQGGRMVIIDHRGERYRLLETRNGKLILQK
ncbi:MAG: hemin uptake protein HemP [Pirellulaceae bacterium]|nr:hemin uptake protein HemP [Planctomycetales bacterium]